MMEKITKNTEQIFNLYVHVENGLVCNLGITCHSVNGDDKEKMLFLQKNAAQDIEKAVKYPFPTALVETSCDLGEKKEVTLEMVSYISRTGQELLLFEHVFQEMNAPHHPLYCLAVVEDGNLRNDGGLMNVSSDGNDDLIVYKGFNANISKVDYLSRYSTSKGLNITELLGDDFLDAIKLLYEHGHYVSAMKLILSFLDTLSYVEFGDVSGSCEKWIATYLDLEKVGVTASQIWQLRNGLLHMTNPHSRCVLSGKETPLCFYVYSDSRAVIKERDGSASMFSFEALYYEIMDGVGRWVSTYKGSFEKQLTFIERYDLILSEGRVSQMSSSNVSV